jgi:hypothetical protein
MKLPESYLPSDMPGLVRQLSTLWRSLQTLVGTLDSGTYTPATTLTTNVTTATGFSGQWQRVGNTVTVSVRVDVTPTAAGTVVVGLALPVTPSFTNFSDCAGCGTAVQGTNYLAVAVSADPTPGAAKFSFQAPNTSVHQVWMTFTYRLSS